ncbi:hypothetical protein [Kumtagia ephedrae]|nr:hypothetical protein [Mesorhizobium ephedrae]
MKRSAEESVEHFRSNPTPSRDLASLRPLADPPLKGEGYAGGAAGALP